MAARPEHPNTRLSEQESPDGRSGPDCFLDQLQIAGGFLAAILHDVEAHSLAFDQHSNAGALNRGDVNEHVLAAAIGLNEAETLLSIEPFDFTVRHLDLEKTRVPPCAIARRAELQKG